MPLQLVSVVGFVVLLGVGYALSRDRKAISLRMVAEGARLLVLYEKRQGTTLTRLAEATVTLAGAPCTVASTSAPVPTFRPPT